MGATRAQLNRKVRQDALRQQLEAQGHLQHVTDILSELNNPDVGMKADILARKKVVIDTKLKLINKYLPDLKSTEITGDPDNPVVVSAPVQFIAADD